VALYPAQMLMASVPGNTTIFSSTVYPSEAVSEPVFSSTYAEGVVVILVFKSAYLLSEINADVRLNMTLAISSVLEVPTSNLVLTFTEAVMGRTLLQQKGVLVTVGIKGYHLSSSSFTTRITQDNINAKMAIFGLKPAQIMYSEAGMCEMDIYENLLDHFTILR
jgi:hypothetical protein